ncbi:hypothetical protein PROFUN_10842 [Planoprotostelium fungivorum]|uniref:Large ribosomal subunit protein bL28m n=1 Tax=Planoprotostelium fungivorum TaxID=1890364 RepID=A0A2P6NCS4_9EUKA|nr:hypothetical protein PROFUN_10842 [Planoprotostelium fungivorum]
MAANPNIMKSAQRGLYGGKRISFGNYVGFSDKKTGRTWYPNIVRKNLFSDLLDKTYTLNVTTHVIRTITKKGNFDNYMLYTRPDQLDSERGRLIQNKIISAWETQNNRKFHLGTIINEDRQQGGNIKRIISTYADKNLG